MDREVVTLGNIEIEKNKFYRHKTPIVLADIDIEKTLVSNKISFGEKNFIRYLYDDHKVRPLHIMPPKTTAYVKRYDGQTKWMYFLIENDDLLEKYSIIIFGIKSVLISKKNLITCL